MKRLIRIIAESIEDIDYEDLDDSVKDSEFSESGSYLSTTTLMLPNSDVIIMTVDVWDEDGMPSYQIDKGTSIEDIKQIEVAKIIYKYIDHFVIQQKGDARPSNILDYFLNSIDKGIERAQEMIAEYARNDDGYGFNDYEESRWLGRLAFFNLQRSSLLEGGKKAFVAFYEICESELFEHEFSNFVQALEPK